MSHRTALDFDHVSRDRKHLRYLAQLTVSYREPTALEPSTGGCLDISPAGLFVETPKPAARGVLLRFECAGANAAAASIRGTARVMWLRAAADAQGPAGMGLKFVRLEPGGARAIEALVEAADAASGRKETAGAQARAETSEPAVVLGADHRIGARRASSVPPPASTASASPSLRTDTLRRGAESAAPSASSGSNAASDSDRPGAGSLRERLDRARRLDASAANAAAAQASIADSAQAAESTAAHTTGTRKDPSGKQHLGSTLIHGSPPPPAGVHPPSDQGFGVPSPPPPPWKARNSSRPPSPGGVEVVRSVHVAGSHGPSASSHTAPRVAPAAAAQAQAAEPASSPDAAAAQAEASQHVAEQGEWDSPPANETRNPALRPGPPHVSTPFILPSDTESGRHGQRFVGWTIVVSGVLVSLLLIKLFGRMPVGLPPGTSTGAAQTAPAAPSPSQGTPPEGTGDTPAAVTPQAQPTAIASRIVLDVHVSPTGATVTAGNQEATSPGRLEWPIKQVVWPLRVRAEMAGFGTEELTLSEDMFSAVGTSLRYDLTATLEPAHGESAPRTTGTPNAAAAPAEPSAATASPRTSTTVKRDSRKKASASAVPPVEAAVQPAAEAAVQPAADLEPAPAATPAVITPAAAQPMIAAAPPPAEPAAASVQKPLERALECLSKADNPCVVSALANARTQRELDLLIETHRTMGNTAGTDAAMRRYVELHPDGKNSVQYRRALGIE